MGDKNDELKYMEGNYSIEDPGMVLAEWWEDTKQAQKLSQEAEYMRKVLEYLKEKEKEHHYLVDGATLTCTRCKLEPDTYYGGTFTVPEGSKESKLKVTHNTSFKNGAGQYFATIRDIEFEPFGNCKNPPDREAERKALMLSAESEELCQYGTCRYLMDLNDEWENWLSNTGYQEVTELNGDSVETITMEAILFCKHGGFIRPIDSGYIKTETEQQFSFEEELREKGFPEGYVKYLMILHEKYPDWKFEPVFTGVDYQEFLKCQITNEYKCSQTAAYSTSKIFSGEVDKIYYVATSEAIRFFSHPYSMLQTNQGSYENALQFLRGDQQLPKEYVDSVVNSLLSKEDVEVRNAIMNSNSCVNPVFMASIYMGENGPVGEYYNGKKVYNLFNVGAYSGKTSSLEYAYNHSWFSVEKCIGESEDTLQGYLDRGQNTLYALDWDFEGFKNGTVHQYATLVEDAENKAINMAKRGTMFNLQYEFVFSIPVYENIPTYNNEEYAAFPDPNKIARGEVR